MSDQAARLAPLAILPNGEAVRPEEVRGVLIEAAASLVEEAGERFSVAVPRDGTCRVVAANLSRPDAVDMSRRCARAINEAARQAGEVGLGPIGRWLGHVARPGDPPPASP